MPPPPSSVYGPVASWRFGRSLGIDPILQTSTCSFNCIYCQLGNIQQHTAEQRVYVPTERIIADLEAVDWDGVDVVTVSGSGEPTLAANLDEIVAHLKRLGRKPVMVLTNATMLTDAATRARLYGADVVAAKLDAATDPMLARMNRPVPGVTIERIVAGIEALRRDDQFSGRLAIQTMLMPVNIGELPALAQLIARICPDEIHLNTPKRPYPRAWYQEARGDHRATCEVEKVALKTITLEQAQEAEEALRTACPSSRILSVYQEAPEA